jgi:hypothetical protein
VPRYSFNTTIGSMREARQAGSAHAAATSAAIVHAITA